MSALGFICLNRQSGTRGEEVRLESATIAPSDAAALGLHWDSEGIFRFPDQLVRLVEFDLVRSRIDDEQKAALADEVAIFKSDVNESSSDLRTQLYLFYRRELTQKLEPSVYVFLQWSTNSDHRCGGQ